MNSDLMIRIHADINKIYRQYEEGFTLMPSNVNGLRVSIRLL